MSDEYQQIRVLWPDHLNLPRGKYLPVAVAAGGARHCLTTFALNYDRYMGPVPGTGFLEGMPDLTCDFSLDDVRPGWEDGVGVVLGDLGFEGSPVPFAPREVLRRAVAAWEDMGYTPKVASSSRPTSWRPTATAAGRRIARRGRSSTEPGTSTTPQVSAATSWRRRHRAGSPSSR